MADINEVLSNLCSDLKAVGQEVGRRTGDAVELSRLKLEHLKLKNRVRDNYERLGEIIYGGYKNKEDVSDVIAVLYEQLDEDFAEIERLFAAMNAVKAGYATYAEAEAAGEAEPEEEPSEEKKADPEIEKEIDEINILNATFLAMKRAIASLSVRPDLALIDGNQKPHTDIEEVTVIKGDAKSMSIAAASVLAKVSRDRFMLEMAEKYPQYQFARHKGYGTKLHYEKIAQYGVCDIHRRTFLKKILGEQK